MVTDDASCRLCCVKCSAKTVNVVTGSLNGTLGFHTVLIVNEDTWIFFGLWLYFVYAVLLVCAAKDQSEENLSAWIQKQVFHDDMRDTVSKIKDPKAEGQYQWLILAE